MVWSPSSKKTFFDCLVQLSLKFLLFCYFSFECCLYLSNRGKNSILFSDFSISGFLHFIYFLVSREGDWNLNIFVLFWNIVTETAELKKQTSNEKKFKREFQNIFSSNPLKGVMVRKVVCSFLPNKLQKKMSWKKSLF